MLEDLFYKICLTVVQGEFSEKEGSAKEISNRGENSQKDFYWPSINPLAKKVTMGIGPIRNQNLIFWPLTKI